MGYLTKDILNGFDKYKVIFLKVLRLKINENHNNLYHAIVFFILYDSTRHETHRLSQFMSCILSGTG